MGQLKNGLDEVEGENASIDAEIEGLQRTCVEGGKCIVKSEFSLLTYLVYSSPFNGATIPIVFNLLLAKGYHLCIYLLIFVIIVVL